MGIKSDWYLLEDDEKAIVSLKERIENLITIATRTTRSNPKIRNAISATGVEIYPHLFL